MANTSPVAWDVRFLLASPIASWPAAKLLRFIAEQHGTFLTILPRTRKEMDDFEDYAKQHPIPLAGSASDDPHPRRKDGPDSVYHGWESPSLSKRRLSCAVVSQLAKIASGTRNNALGTPGRSTVAVEAIANNARIATPR